MTTTIHFNTGRKYTVHGQRITATLHDDGIVTFWDHDRQVDGQYTAPEGVPFTQQGVMAAYDNYAAPGSIRSYEDGLQRGGCNTQYADPSTPAPSTIYTVVENAGYEREHDVNWFSDYGKAARYVDRQYSADERDSEHPDCLHVGIRADYPDGTCEYI